MIFILTKEWIWYESLENHLVLSENIHIPEMKTENEIELIRETKQKINLIHKSIYKLFLVAKNYSIGWKQLKISCKN